eukprot:1601067-Pleurochrysis_carterae.AAC.1
MGVAVSNGSHHPDSCRGKRAAGLVSGTAVMHKHARLSERQARLRACVLLACARRCRPRMCVSACVSLCFVTRERSCLRARCSRAFVRTRECGSGCQRKLRCM